MTTTETTGHVYDTEAHNIDRGGAFRVAVTENAYPVLPEELHTLLDVREAIFTRQMTGAPGIPARGEEMDIFARALLDGRTVDEALDTVADIHQARDRAQGIDFFLNLAMQGWDRRISNTLTRSLPEVLTGLRAPLTETVDALRQAYAAAGNLDIDRPDPMDVAKATPKQQQALVDVAELTKRYRTIRRHQRIALEASASGVPGELGTWEALYSTHIHELKTPDMGEIPPPDTRPRLAVRAVVTRNDVWIPTPDEQAEALKALAQRISHRQQQAAQLAAAQAEQHTGMQPTLDPGTTAWLDAHTHNAGTAHPASPR